MASWVITRRIGAPVERAFAAFTDFDFAAETIEGIKGFEVLTEGGFREGARFRETRVMGKKERTEEMWVSAYEAGRGYTISAASCGCEMHFDHSFRAVEGGSEVEMAGRMRAVSLGAKLTRPLWPLMNVWMKKCVNKDLDEMIGRIEAEAASQDQLGVETDSR
ncbi:MAG: SRPBCC family protein [Phycisphaerales bacterium JB059]